MIDWPAFVVLVFLCLLAALRRGWLVLAGTVATYALLRWYYGSWVER